MLRFSKIIAAVLVLLAIVLAGYAWMLSRQPAPKPVMSPQAQPPVTTYPVVVATRSLPAGEPIPADALRVAQLSVNPSGALKSIDAAAGKVPALDLGQGTPLLESQMATGLALKLDAGERAVAVRADEVIGVGNNVRPGDFVDVFFILKADNREIDRGQARLLLARKRVLAYGQSTLDALPPDETGSADGAEGSGGRTIVSSRSSASNKRAAQARTVVLAVPVEDVNRLTLAEASGRLLLALRNPADATEPDSSLFADLPPALQPKAAKPGQPALSGIDRAAAGIATADLANGGSSTRVTTRAAAHAANAAPGRPRPAGTEVEIIRGDRRDTVHY